MREMVLSFCSTAIQSVGVDCPKWVGVAPSVPDGGLVRNPKWRVRLRHNRVKKTSRGARLLHRNGSAQGVSRMRVTGVQNGGNN